jgi:hypothetical protein
MKKKHLRSDYQVRLIGKPDDKYVLSKYKVQVLFSGAFSVKSVISDKQFKKLGVF